MLPLAYGRNRLVVDIDRGSDPISGTIWHGEHELPFRGWLQLISMLDAAIEYGHPRDEIGRAHV